MLAALGHTISGKEGEADKRDKFNTQHLRMMANSGDE